MIVVVRKQSRLKTPYKFHGNLLNEKVHYYTRHVKSNTNPLSLLNDIRKENASSHKHVEVISK